MSTELLAGLSSDDKPATPEIPLGEQPQARFESYGAAALSDTELLAMALRGAVRTPGIMAQASSMIAEAGSLAGLATWKSEDFTRYGIGPTSAWRLAVLPEIARRMSSVRTEGPVLNRPELIAQLMQPITIGLEVEKFWVICVDRKNRMIRRAEVTSGTATAALAHPREVFRIAIRCSASAVICVHNHPSGDPAPSAPDLHITRQLREAGKAVDIELIDHVIIGRAGVDPSGKGFFSFMEAGIIST